MTAPLKFTVKIKHLNDKQSTVLMAKIMTFKYGSRKLYSISSGWKKTLEKLSQILYLRKLPKVDMKQWSMKNCKRHGYNNGATMTGIYKGVQACEHEEFLLAF